MKTTIRSTPTFRGLLMVVVGSVLCFTGCFKEKKADSPIQPGSATTGRKPVSKPIAPVLDDCPGLSNIEAGTGSMKLCGAAPVTTVQECPVSDQIVILIDNDDETARRRRGANVPATDWQHLLDDVVSIGRTECRGGERPLERLPGRCGTIQGAVAGWNLGACRSGGQLFPRFLTTGSGGTTPATEVVQRITREMSSAGGTPGVTVMAFDGIVDGDYRNAAARIAFAEAVAGAVGSQLKVWIIASPVDYRYIYVFARPQYEEFTARAVAALAGVLQARSGLRVVVASLSEARFRDPAARAGVAKAAIRRSPVSGVHWGSAGLSLRRRQRAPETHGEMWRLDLRRWMEATSGAPGAMVRLSWNADHSEWDELVPFGVRLPPPILHLNRAVHASSASDANAAWARADDVTVELLEGCAPRVRSQQRPLAQGASIAPGRADFLLVRGGAANATWLNAVPDWTADPQALRRGLISSSGPPLVAAVLVTLAPRRSGCTEALLTAFAGSHRWGSGRLTPDLATVATNTDCQSTQWAGLIDAFRQVEYRRFRPGAATPSSPNDGRVAVETFLTVAETVGRRLLAGSGAVDTSCVLGTFQLESETVQQGNALWRQEPLP